LKLVGLVSFYDERPDWLSACVASLSRCCDHVVALDGAYRLFPQAKAHSGDVQAGAIVATAQSLGMGVTYSAPGIPWLGNEVEKRNRLLELGKAVSDEDDWFLVLDADSIVRDIPSDLHARLEQTTHDVGTYFLTEAFEGGTGRYEARYLYRARRDLHIEQTHFGYRANGSNLWENGGLPACQTDLVVEHRRHERGSDRSQRAEQYYLLRDTTGIER
jgi:hypothetical protein